MSVSTHISESLKQDISRSIKETIGLNDDLLNQLSTAILLKFQEKLGGQRVYIPVANKKDRDAMVLLDLNTMSFAEVTRKYDISLATLYRIMGR